MTVGPGVGVAAGPVVSDVGAGVGVGVGDCVGAAAMVGAGRWSGVVARPGVTNAAGTMVGEVNVAVPPRKATDPTAGSLETVSDATGAPSAAVTGTTVVFPATVVTVISGSDAGAAAPGSAAATMAPVPQTTTSAADVRAMTR
ncbi:hypothetical protein [Curtobacterium sp. MCBD17_040]|uniref:hypothetical protein n=1 Tax=Curtobacterium sp. MCBD17_040 TaxID=2175674 RepID=UPI0011B81A57|nr:hypothetical protein [Curtobacterium sp. MCBD17_040]WIB65322.1 hypothetical protein DEI94_18115 [Curtobacterium sp. MCBD17_040]